MTNLFKTTTSKVVELPIISMEEVEIIPVYVTKMSINASKDVMAKHLEKIIDADSSTNNHNIWAPTVFTCDWTTNAKSDTTEYFLEISENPEEITIVVKKRIYKFS